MEEILIDERNGLFCLNTKNTCYIFGKTEKGRLFHCHYGLQVDSARYCKRYDKNVYSFCPYPSDEDEFFSYESAPNEYSVFGSGSFSAFSFSARSADGRIYGDLRFVGYSVDEFPEQAEFMPRARNKSRSLKVMLADVTNSVQAELYYYPFFEEDIIVRQVIIKNNSAQEITLQKAYSYCLDLPEGKYECIEFAGRYGMERIPVRSRLNGVKCIRSTAGVSGHKTNPFFALVSSDATEEHGEAYGFNLIYSGNFCNEIDVNQLGCVRICGGINAETFSWRLKSGECFVTPEAVLTYSGKGIGQLSRNFHDFIRRHIIDPNFAFAPRPVVANTWEAAYFSLDEKSVLALASTAAKAGADTVVIDDGWFADRRNDTAGLGNWKIDEEKFPSGFRGLESKLRGTGMKLGIWIEPECVNMGSMTFSEHPEWLLQGDGLLSRSQYVLDMANADVIDYLFENISALLRSADFSYVKWDMNRYITDCFSATLPACRQGEFYHRYVLGVYRLFWRLKSAFPQIFFEGCCGGGGRFDLGMLYFAPQIWASDNTDPYERTRIQYGTSLAYPLSAISSHMADGKNGGTNMPSSPEFRWLASAFCAFGYELNLTNLPKKQLDRLRRKIENRKKWEKLVYEGDLYRISDPFEEKVCCLMLVSKDKTHAVMFVLRLEGEANVRRKIKKAKGLNASKHYVNSYDRQNETGKTYMNAGLDIALDFGGGTGTAIEFIEKKESKRRKRDE